MAICLCLTGCARTEQISRQDIPTWDEGILPEERDFEKPSLFKRLLSDDSSDYHFRKVRWGFSRERVEFSEARNTVFERRGNAVVYNELHEINFPALELSFYEKQLMGVLLKGRRLKIHGIGTIPQ